MKHNKETLEKIREGARKGGLKGGKATGQSKNRMKNLTPEERSKRMREIRRGKKLEGTN